MVRRLLDHPERPKQGTAGFYQKKPIFLHTAGDPFAYKTVSTLQQLNILTNIYISITISSLKMVSYKEIKASNAIIHDAAVPYVAVFVGGTSGIGKATVKSLVATGITTRIYLVGRKSSKERTIAFIEELHNINEKAHVIWVEGEVSLLAETKRVCQIIKSKEEEVDLLFFTTGYAPFGKRRETTEGIEVTQSLAYYLRILFILHLLPLLNKAAAPRVMGVLGGGLEWARGIDLDDLGLKKPGNFGFIKAQMQYAAMNTTTLEKLANDNPNVTFIHSWPGWVDTGNARRGVDPDSILIAWLVRLFLEPIVCLFSYSEEESGERHLFQSTSAAFGGRGVSWAGKPGINSKGEPANGLFLVNYKCECTPNGKAISLLRKNALEKVWEHTQEVLEPYL